jgi:hypothetical protein
MPYIKTEMRRKTKALQARLHAISTIRTAVTGSAKKGDRYTLEIMSRAGWTGSINCRRQRGEVNAALQALLWREELGYNTSTGAVVESLRKQLQKAEGRQNALKLSVRKAYAKLQRRAARSEDVPTPVQVVEMVADSERVGELEQRLHEALHAITVQKDRIAYLEENNARLTRRGMVLESKCQKLKGMLRGVIDAAGTALHYVADASSKAIGAERELDSTNQE